MPEVCIVFSVTSSLPPNKCQHTSLSEHNILATTNPPLCAAADSRETTTARHFRGGEAAISQSDYNLGDPVMVCASACEHEQLWCNPVCTAR